MDVFPRELWLDLLWSCQPGHLSCLQQVDANSLVTFCVESMFQGLILVGDNADVTLQFGRLPKIFPASVAFEGCHFVVDSSDVFCQTPFLRELSSAFVTSECHIFVGRFLVSLQIVLLSVFLVALVTFGIFVNRRNVHSKGACLSRLLSAMLTFQSSLRMSM